MSGEAPRLIGLGLRLAATWLLWNGVGAVIAFGCLPVLAIDPSTGALALALVLGVAAVFALGPLGWTLAAARRVLARQKAEETVDSGALARLFAAPRLVTVATTAGVALALILLAVGRPLAIGPRSGALLALAAFGILQAAGLRAGLAWRASIGAITDRIPPAVVRVPTGRFLAATFGVRFASVAFAVTAVVGAALAARVSWLSPLLPFGLALLVAALVFRRGWALGRLVVADLEDLRAYAALAAAGSAWVEESVVPAPPTRVRATSSVPVAQAVVQLTQRYAEMARAEERARQSVRQTRALKTRFMALMSHDLRSPLNSITGFAEVLSEGLDGPLEEGQRESVTAIREAGEDLTRLVTDILDTARLEAGRLPLEPEWVPMVTLLGNAIGQARSRLRSDKVALEPQLEAGLPPLYVDPERVVQALVGILTHVGRLLGKGTIVLDVRRVDEGIRVVIRAADLPADDSRRIFEALRAVRASSGQRAGLGLGLALARGLVEANGGSLIYKGLSDGVRFTLVLPSEKRA